MWAHKGSTYNWIWELCSSGHRTSSGITGRLIDAWHLYSKPTSIHSSQSQRGFLQHLHFTTTTWQFATSHISWLRILSSDHLFKMSNFLINKCTSDLSCCRICSCTKHSKEKSNSEIKCDLWNSPVLRWWSSLLGGLLFVPSRCHGQLLWKHSSQEAVRLTQWKQGHTDLKPNNVTEHKALSYERNDGALYRMLLIFLNRRSKEIADVLALFERLVCLVLPYETALQVDVFHN